MQVPGWVCEVVGRYVLEAEAWKREAELLRDGQTPNREGEE